MKYTLFTVVLLACVSSDGFAQKIDTIVRSVKPNLDIPGNSGSTQAIGFPGHTLPYFSTLLDVDLYLDITLEDINDMAITLFAPVGRQATVMPYFSCYGQSIQNPKNIKATLNDQAFDINYYNQTGQKILATFTCTADTPSIGSFNQGQMTTNGDFLEVFNSTDWILGGQCGMSYGFTVRMIDINATTNRFSSMEILNFILEMGLNPGERVLLTYKNAQGGVLTGLELKKVYMFQVLNNHTLELINVDGSDLTAIPPGAIHEFIFQRDWLLVFSNFKPDSHRTINEVALKLAFVDEPCINTKSADDMENLVPDHHAETRNDFDETAFTAYPNPFGDQLTVGMSGEGMEGQWSIRSLDGRLVYGPVVGANFRDITTSGWASGMYMVEWRDARKVRQVLVVKR